MAGKYVQHCNAEYVMPFLFVHDIFIPVLNELLKDEINPIKYVYGIVKSEWSGGRLSCTSINNLSVLNRILDKVVNKHKLIPAFPFTNRTMTKERLNNEFCNNLLDIAYEKGCHFIVASDKLYEHITSRYKDAHMVSSVIVPSIKIHEAGFDETKFYNEMLDKYEIVVLRPEYTMENLNKLDKLIKDVSRVEVLINQKCHWDCRVAKLHYRMNEKIETGKITPDKFNNVLNIICPKKKDGYKSVCMNDEIVSTLLSMGITKLKIQGRDTYDYPDMLNELYNCFFNNEISKEEIENNINLIISKFVQNNKQVAFSLL